MEQIEDQANVTEMENGSTVTVQQGQVLQQSSPQTSMPPPMQTPSVIQANQQSVIQTAQSIHSASLQGQQISLAQAVQVNDPDDPTGGVLDEESKKRRDILSRRPSYRYAKSAGRSSIDRFLVNMIQPGSLHAICSVIFHVFNIQTKTCFSIVFRCTKHLESNVRGNVKADVRYCAKVCYKARNVAITTIPLL